MSDMTESILSRIGSEYDGECHLSEAEAREVCSRIASLETEVQALRKERDDALARSQDYPAISAKLADREKARDAEQKACREAIAESTALKIYAGEKSSQYVAAMEENKALRKALERSVVAIDDWLNIYAEDHCNADRVAEAKARTNENGTLWYIATTQEANRKALRARLASTERTEGK